MPHATRKPIPRLKVERLPSILVHQMELGIPLRMSTRRMDMQSPEERAPFVQHPLWLLILEILVSKGDNASLGDEEGELLFLTRAEEMELNTRDFRAKARRQLSRERQSASNSGMSSDAGKTHVVNGSIFQELPWIVVLQRLQSRIMVFEVRQGRVRGRVVKVREETGVLVSGIVVRGFLGGVLSRDRSIRLRSKTEGLECGKGLGQGCHVVCAIQTHFQASWRT